MAMLGFWKGEFLNRLGAILLSLVLFQLVACRVEVEDSKFENLKDATANFDTGDITGGAIAGAPAVSTAPAMTLFFAWHLRH